MFRQRLAGKHYTLRDSIGPVEVCIWLPTEIKKNRGSSINRARPMAARLKKKKRGLSINRAWPMATRLIRVMNNHERSLTWPTGTTLSHINA